MSLPKLNMPPAQAGYGAAQGPTFKQAKLGGGRSRFRLDERNAAIEVEVQWVCTGIQWQYLQAFNRSAIEAGSLDFLIDLVVDAALPTEYRAHLMPGSLALVGVQGLTYTASARLEVIPSPPDREADAAVLDLYDAYAEDSSDLIRALARLVNEDMTVLS